MIGFDGFLCFSLNCDEFPAGGGNIPPTGGGVPSRVVPRQGAGNAQSEHTKERIHTERASGSAGKRGA